MNTIDISYLGLGVGLLLLAMPIYFFIGSECVSCVPR